MTESPDAPWAKDHDSRIKTQFKEPPSPAAVFFHEFLLSAGKNNGRIVDIGCGNGRNAIFFAKHGYEVHAVDRSDDILKDMDLHGVMPYCHSVTEYWLFEDEFFDFAIDIFCYCYQEDDKREFYRTELSRVLKAGAMYLLCVPLQLKETARTEFSGFKLLAEKEIEDSSEGKKTKAVAFIFSR